MSGGEDDRFSGIGGREDSGQEPSRESDPVQAAVSPTLADSDQPLPQWSVIGSGDHARPSTGPQQSTDGLLNKRSSTKTSSQNSVPKVETPVRGGRRRMRPLLLAVGGLALLALGAAGYAAFAQRSDNGSSSSAEISELTSNTVPNTVNDIQMLLQGIGYDAVEVEERDGTIYVSGILENQSDIAAVVTASASLANGFPISTDGLTIGPLEPTGPDIVETDESDDGARVVQADPLQRLQVVLNRTVAATPIIFEPATSEIASWNTDTLDQVAGILLANPGIAVAVVGYTDDSGPAEQNQTLSLDRANAVRDYLVDQGVAPGLIQTDARGESEATGVRDVGYLERRVEFEVVAASAAPPAVRPLNVGIIVPSPADDVAFSQSLVDALDVLDQERGGLTVTITENMFDPDEGREQARQYVDDGADVVILHGAEFLPIIEDLATEFPNVVFVTGPDGYETDLSNVFVYVVYAEQGAYVMGDLAANLSDSDTVGIVGPIEVPEPQRYVDGFRAGAEAQGARVLADYVGSFNDVEVATALAESHADDGADVLTGTSELTIGPIGVADQRDLLWFANQTNQSKLAPDNVVASQVYHFEVAIREILAEIDADSTSGGTFPMTLANGGMLIEFNPDFGLDPALRRRADDLLFNVTAGSLNVEVDVE